MIIGGRTIREQLEAAEEELLGTAAQRSTATKGRAQPEDEDEVRPAFQRDLDRILHSKSFRRLAHKTQVFLAPEGDHYRTRITHTLEVSRVARTISDLEQQERVGPAAVAEALTYRSFDGLGMGAEAELNGSGAAAGRGRAAPLPGEGDGPPLRGDCRRRD